jgi:voltage-gated potassium channel
MAANSSTGPTTTASAAKKLTTYDLAIGILALFSLIILVLLIFVPLSSSTADTLNTLENLLCIVFLFDFFRSLFRAQNKWNYFIRGGGWLDLLGSIPFGKFAVFRVARLFRIVRAMRTLRGNDFSKMLRRRLAESVLLFTLVVALLLIFLDSGIVLYAEHRAPNANIKTYSEAVWWALVTITTVGYGDYYPVTTLGRTGAVILMFFGLGIIGVLSSYLSTTFISLERRRRERRERREAGKENGEEDDDEENEKDSRDAELAAIREELAALRKLFEEHYQPQEEITTRSADQPAVSEETR